MHLKKFLHSAIVFLTLGLAIASAQIQDTSQDTLLTGSYRFRHIAVVNVDQTLNPTEIAASSGTITFDGAGNYVIIGTEVDNTIAAGSPQPLVVTGTYAIGSNGAGYVSNPLFPSDPGSWIYGAASQGIFTGSSTEAGYSGGELNDIFIAIPVGSQVNSGFNIPYQVGLLDFTNGASAAVKNALFALVPDGAGNIAGFTLTGQANNQGAVSLTQTVPSGGTYNFVGGAATLTLPLPNGVTSGNALITGTKTLFQSLDGNFVLGWSPNGYDIFFGVKSLTSPASNNTTQGLYFTTALEDSITNFGVDSYYGSTNNSGNNAGDGIVHQRLTNPGGYAFDLGLDDKIVVNANGSTGTDLNGYQYVFGAAGQAFVAIGTNGNFSLQTGIHAAAFSGPGVYLNPIGVVNAASQQPVTASIAPGELLVLIGTGLSSGTLVSPGNQAFPTTLGGVTIFINGLVCPIYYVTSTQLAVIVPYAVTSNQTGLANIQVNNNGVPSNIVQVYLTDAAPGAFTAGADGIGYGMATHANGQVITQNNPVTGAETIAVYVTGLGNVTPKITDGAIGPSALDTPPNPLASADLYTTSNLHVYFDDYVTGSTHNEGTILSASLAPRLAGLYQINVTLPTNGLTSGHNLYVELATDHANVVQMQIPYGPSAIGGRAISAPVPRARILAARLKPRAPKPVQ